MKEASSDKLSLNCSLSKFNCRLLSRCFTLGNFHKILHKQFYCSTNFLFKIADDQCLVRSHVLFAVLSWQKGNKISVMYVNISVLVVSLNKN